MNQEQIIKMALDSGMAAFKHSVTVAHVTDLERFAALVAAAEREKVARWQIGSGYTTGHGDSIEDLLVELEWQVRESEREACAKVCESMRPSEQEFDQRFYTACTLNANAIRARGQA